ncbi:hypothetical protein PPL_00894 [Heterostelium album PN500]|uniref:Prolyl 4-hydroxylase alpha subunit Fe(2+) 2OG dioxygenase domain-containing protein n=1 Tax=Heterostelium pallidum (strain ATCC 26659 / Pp 5 / PN500) TaxID=670386 RepID=D3AYX5_HETP5|nr:hypothetical protein PPL_00894 [Heterostelium album PN500]EFA85665.1 hypothetical protein PPL_00894 [Heterostelium album PN500]|eukprot:XP_020437772.1 hypothetical protein PPL_00894 [Heterostelium album PN500]
MLKRPHDIVEISDDDSDEPIEEEDEDEEEDSNLTDDDSDEQSSEDDVEVNNNNNVEDQFTDEQLANDDKKLFKVLTGTLKSFKKTGSFYCIGEEEVAPPRIEINEVGVLSFPVPECQVKKIIDKCIRAPYGKGTETITDTNIRKVWQLSPDSFKFIGGSQWNQFFERTIKMIGVKLGLGNTKIEAELYKMLIYDKGAFFKPHKDSEKGERMFGTLVISLPSVHTGGDLILQHAGKTVTVSLENDSVSNMKYSAFYADIKHEVKEVTDGYRVCLVYNLCRSGKLNNDDLITKKPKIKKDGNALKKQKMIDVKKEEQEDSNISSDEDVLIGPVDSKGEAIVCDIRKYLSLAFRKPERNCLVYIFEHEYTQYQYNMRCLKGQDAKIASSLLKAISGTGYSCLIGLLSIKEEGTAEDDYYSSKEGFNVCDSDIHFKFKHLIDAGTNKSYHGLKLNVDESDIFPSFDTDDCDWDDPEIEHTGNEGTTFERFYSHSAIVIVEDIELDLYNNINGEEEKIDMFEQKTHLNLDAKRRSFNKMVSSMARYSSYKKTENAPTRLINHFYNLYSQGDGIEHADSILTICNIIADRTITDTHFCDKLSRCFNILAKHDKQIYITKSLTSFASHSLFNSKSNTFFKLLEQSMGLEPTFIGEIDKIFTKDSTNNKSETKNDKLESIPTTELESIILEAYKNKTSPKISDVFDTYCLIILILNKIGNQQQTESLLNTINPLLSSKIAVTLNISEWKGVPETIDFIVSCNLINDETKHIYIDTIVDSFCANNFRCHSYRIGTFYDNLESIYELHLKHKSYFHTSNLMKIIDLIISHPPNDNSGEKKLSNLTTLIEISLSTKNEQLLDKICAQSTPDELLTICERQLNRLKEQSCPIEEIRLFGKMWCRAIIPRFESATNVKYPSSNIPPGSYSYQLEQSYNCRIPKCECMKVAAFLLSEAKVLEFPCRMNTFPHIENAFSKFKNFVRYEKIGTYSPYRIKVTKLHPTLTFLNADIKGHVDSLTRCKSAILHAAIGKLTNDYILKIYFRAVDNRLNELTTRLPITPVKLQDIPPFSTTTASNSTTTTTKNK